MEVYYTIMNKDKYHNKTVYDLLSSDIRSFTFIEYEKESSFNYQTLKYTLKMNENNPTETISRFHKLMLLQE